MHASRIHGPLLSLCLATLLSAPQAFAQSDAMGPDLMKLLLAFPMLVVYAIGELALFAVPLLAALAIVSWLTTRFGGNVPRAVPDTSVLLVWTAILAVPAAVYWVKGPDREADQFKVPKSTTRREPKPDPLAPPVGRSWPRETGYLDMPQLAQNGHGRVKVAAGFSYRAYVKLCEAGKQPCPGLRHAYLQRHESFEFRQLPEGSYEVRYRLIDQPRLAGRSQPFTITGYEETPHVVKIDESPVLESRYPVVGILPKDF